MSIKELPGRIKIRHTDDNLTNNAALLAHHGLATRLDLIEKLETTFHSYTSNRAYRDFKYPYLQVLSHASGGIGIEETRKISSDLSLGRIMFPDQKEGFDNHPSRTESYFPAPNTLGDWYRQIRSRHGHRARKINRQLCTDIINQTEPGPLHIDIDSKMHASSNEKARRNRDGIKGYAPLYATIPGLKLVLDPLFRPGNAHPASHNASMTRTILNWLKTVSPEKVEITIDNAGCQVEVMNAVQRAQRRSDKQIHIYTRPSSPDKTLPKKMFESIKQEEDDWQPIQIYYEKNRTKYRYLSENGRKERDNDVPPVQILDTDYTLASDDDDFCGRLVLVREPVVEEGPQKSFEHGWHYTPVLTNDRTSDAIEIPGKYNQRGAGEDVIGEIVQGGEAERFPCKEDEGNAVYLALTCMGHNLNQAMKGITDRTFREGADRVEGQTDQGNSKETGDPTRHEGNRKPDLLGKHKYQETAQLLAANTEAFETDTDWMQFTLRKFNHLLMSIPARITTGSGYCYLNFSKYIPFGELLEEVIRACWKPLPLQAVRPPP